jgi:hypothetical protein
MSAGEFSQHVSVVEHMIEDSRRVATMPPVEGKGSDDCGA